MTGLVNSATGLAVLRLFIGIAGGSFVMCQYWTTRFFAKEIVGTANAVVGGWVRCVEACVTLSRASALSPFAFLTQSPPHVSVQSIGKLGRGCNAVGHG
jgi:hypothetical protein